MKQRDKAESLMDHLKLAPHRSSEPYIYSDQFEHKWVNRSFWDEKPLGGGNLTFVNKTTGRDMNVLEAFVYAQIYFTWNGTYSEQHDKYRYHYMTAAVIGDYRNVSYSHHALFETLFEEAVRLFPDDFDVLHWAHHGRQLVVRAIDDQYAITPAAIWFLQTSGYWDNFEKIRSLENTYDQASFNDFIKDIVETQGHGISYGVIDSDRQLHTQSDYRGEDFDYPDGINLDFSKRSPDEQAVIKQAFAANHKQVILDDFIDYIYTQEWPYRNFIQRDWIDKVRQDKKPMGDILKNLQEMGLVEYDDYTHEVYSKYDLVVTPYILTLLKAYVPSKAPLDVKQLDVLEQVLYVAHVNPPLFLERCIEVMGDPEDIYHVDGMKTKFMEIFSNF